MIRLRSVLFHLSYYLWTIALVLVILPVLLMPQRFEVVCARVWQGGTLFLLRWVVGLRWQVRGLEHLPEGGTLIASKHQSAWDTVIFHMLVNKPCYVLKQELLSIPVLGWHLAHHGNIPVDRKAGSSALKSMLRGCQAALERREQIILFPEGTRTAVGAAEAYQPGIGLIYDGLKIPVVPVALNSGLFWARGALVLKPGTITIEFLPPIAPGLSRREFLARLQKDIETGTAALVTEAEAQFPWVSQA